MGEIPTKPRIIPLAELKAMEKRNAGGDKKKYKVTRLKKKTYAELKCLKCAMPTNHQSGLCVKCRPSQRSKNVATLL